jgi:hypothetical protein
MNHGRDLYETRPVEDPHGTFVFLDKISPMLQQDSWDVVAAVVVVIQCPVVAAVEDDVIQEAASRAWRESKWFFF